MARRWSSDLRRNGAINEAYAPRGVRRVITGVPAAHVVRRSPDRLPAVTARKGRCTMPDRVWVWFGSDNTIQHLTTPPDDIQRRWTGETVCGLEGTFWRVSWENVDGAKSCMACRSRPFTLAGDHRGPP